MNMANTASLRVASTVNEQLVAINHAYVSYVDDRYYRKSFHTPKNEEEFKSYQSHPVKVVCVEVGWVLNSEDGLAFLRQLNTTESLDIFEVQCISIIVEYLYGAFKKKVLYYKLPVHLACGIVYLLTILVHEQNMHALVYRGNEINNEDAQLAEPNATAGEHDHADDEVIQLDDFNRWQKDASDIFLGVINMLCSFAIGYQVVQLTRLNGLSYWWSGAWAYLDSAYAILNFVISAMIIASVGIVSTSEVMSKESEIKA